MRISDDDIEAFEKATAAEVFSASFPFPDHLDAIERHFAKRESQLGFGFKLFSTDKSIPNRAIYVTSIGRFELTPTEGILFVPREGNEELKVPFFAKSDETDETTNLASATIRCTGRWVHKLRKNLNAVPTPL